jgi:hypothetical protein
MDNFTPSARRGRPPKEAELEVDATENPTKRRRRAKVGGHAMKLLAPARPGYTRRWVNDDSNRIAQADDLAYDFVYEPDAQSTDVGSRISRLVGTKANGEPLRAYLMETPDELYAEGLAEKAAHNQQIDEAISAGSPVDGRIAPDAEQYGQGSIKRDR